MATHNYANEVLELAKNNKVLRSKDLCARGIPRIVITRLEREGSLERIGRGLYALPNRQISENESLLEIATRSREGVFCLLTALRFHKLTTQSPFEVWLAIPHKGQPPKVENLSLRTIRFSKAALSEGIESHILDGIPIRVYCVEKRIQMDKLSRYAGICKVENVIRPYIESLL